MGTSEKLLQLKSVSFKVLKTSIKYLISIIHFIKFNTFAIDNIEIINFHSERKNNYLILVDVELMGFVRIGKYPVDILGTISSLEISTAFTLDSLRMSLT